MRLMKAFFRLYPARIILVLIALSLSGLAEGVSMSALLPLLNVAINPPTADNPAGDMENEFGQKVVDILASVGLSPTLGIMLLVILAGFTLKSLLLLLAQRQVGYTAARIATDLRLELLRAILRTRWSYFVNQPVGKLTNALATEANRSSKAFVTASTVITFAIQALIYGALAIALSWKATLTGIALGAFIIGITHFLVRMARKAGKRQTKLIGSLLARLTDTLQSVKPLKAMAKEHLASNVLMAETADLNTALERQVLSSAALSAGQDIMLALAVTGGIYVAIEVFGMPFTTVTVLVLALGRMLSAVGKVQKQYQKLVIDESAFWSLKQSIKRATDVEESLHGGVAPSLDKGIQMKGVHFSYDGRRKILDDVDLEFPAKQLSLVVGPSGSGKTTIVDLAIGLLEPSQGKVLLDENSLQSIDIPQWRRMIGYVPQETLLLHDSIRNNVTLGDPEISEDDVRQALRDSDLWDFVNSLPEGMDTIVGERGGKLSGGQRQRIIIARALINQPSLLVLDEATSALDPQSEDALRQTLEKLHGKLTILAIAHSDWLAATADRIYRLEAGKVRQLETLKL